MNYQSRKRTASEIKGALYGTLLGDSTVTNRSEFSCEQISENLIKYKGTILESIAPDLKVYYHTRSRGNIQVIRGKEVARSTTYVVQTNRHPYFSNFREVLYHTGTKQVNLSTLDKLTPEGIALWFMDDGYLDYKKSSNTRNLRICTDSYDETSINNIIRFFNNQYNIQAKVYLHKAGYGRSARPRVSFNAENAQKLIVLMHKYFLPEFYYKLDLHYTEKTLASKRCSVEYCGAVEYMLQCAPPVGEDIV